MPPKTLVDLLYWFAGAFVVSLGWGLGQVVFHLVFHLK
jgi:hypothetical protein